MNELRNNPCAENGPIGALTLSCLGGGDMFAQIMCREVRD
jgi:hypothetical protein